MPITASAPRTPVPEATAPVQAQPASPLLAAGNRLDARKASGPAGAPRLPMERVVDVSLHGAKTAPRRHIPRAFLSLTILFLACSVAGVRRQPVKDMGGLEILKEDLLSKRGIFTQEARDYGLPSPRGILACGQPGTGKSLTAQATGSIFNVPLLRLEAGKLFGSMVGETERNWRTAFATARAIAPCARFLVENTDTILQVLIFAAALLKAIAESERHPKN